MGSEISYFIKCPYSFLLFNMSDIVTFNFSTGSLLLESKIQPDTAYQKQQVNQYAS